MTHTLHIEAKPVQGFYPNIHRAVCAECGSYKWRNTEGTAKTDVRQHAQDATEAETYRSAGGTDG